MHELSVVQAVLEKALEVSQANGSLPLEKIHVRIGKLRQIVPEALAYAFDVVKTDTLAENASLEWEEVSPLVRCRQCGENFEPEDVFWVCSTCGAPGGEILQGEELILQSVSLKEPEVLPANSEDV